DKYDQTKNWNDPANAPVTQLLIATFICPSTPEPKRMDGLPEASPWVPNIAAVTDYSPTIGVDQRLSPAGPSPFCRGGDSPEKLRAAFGRRDRRVVEHHPVWRVGGPAVRLSPQPESWQFAGK